MTARTNFSHLVQQKVCFLFISMVVAGCAAGVSLGQPERPGRSFSEIAKKVAPAIVSIDTKSKIGQPPGTGSGIPSDPDDILNSLRGQLPPRPVYAVGSGFIVDKSGYIITNAHVIEDADRITVKLDSGDEFPATVVGFDGREETDLAVLKIDSH